MYTVKEAARIAGVTPHAVRYYDRRGLLREVSRDDAGTRMFDEAAVEWLRIIVLLRSSDMPIGEIKRYADLLADGAVTAAERKVILEQAKVRLMGKAGEIDKAIAGLDHLIDACCHEIA